MWCVPELTDEYIARMEDVLATYEREHDPKQPVVCLDEKPVQLLADVRTGTMQANGIRRIDYEYARRGTANLFVAVQPKVGRYFLQATKTRTCDEFAKMLGRIARAYPDAVCIHLVVDNLNTHRESSVIRYYGPEKGSALWSRFRVHYTPKHGSWLNQAEIAIGMVARECLGKRRLGTIDRLASETGAWRQQANRDRRVITWRFTRRDARRKFEYRPPRLRSGG